MFNRIIPYILVLIIALLIALGPFSAHIVHADWLEIGKGAVLKGLNYFVQFAIFTPSSWALLLAGKIFNYAIGVSVIGTTFKDMTEPGSAVHDGWAICRDIANLAFIFILLFIGIATILQLSGYGAKQVLIKVIIVALLVNFSLVAVKMIIDASNLLAMQFYDAIRLPDSANDLTTLIKTGEGQKSPKNLSAVFVSAFNVQGLYEKFPDEDNQNAILGKLLIISFFGSIIMLIAAFILMAGGLMFIIRMVVLWILMIFAPLAFVAMVLPRTKGFASQWWDKLLYQSFFAPAFLFMYYLVAKIATSGWLKDIRGGGAASLADAFKTGPSEELIGNMALVFDFIIMAVLLVTALIVAQKMGAVGASGAMSMGKSIKGRVQGYAGKITARTAIARPARAITESKVGQAVGRTALGGIAFRGMERAAKVGKLEEVTERKAESQAKLGMSLAPGEQTAYLGKLGARAQEKMYGKLSDTQRAKVAAINPNAFDGVFKRLESRVGKEAVTEMKAKMGNNMPTATDRLDYFKDMNTDTQKKMFELMSARERVELMNLAPDLKSTFDNLITKLPIEEREKTEKTQKEVERKDLIKRLEDVAKPITPGEREKLHRTISSKEIDDIAKEGGKKAEKLFESFQALGKTNEEIAKKFQEFGNRSAASLMLSSPAMPILKAHGIKLASEKTKEGTKEYAEEQWKEITKKKKPEEPPFTTA